MVKVNKKPIVILANYRTGSSPLACSIAAYNYVVPHYEPNLFCDRKTKFLESYNNGNEFLVKFMPDQISAFGIYQELLARDCYKIKLYRKNKVEQIASYYISAMRDKWWTIKDEYEKDYSLNIDIDVIQQSIKRITTVDYMLDSIDLKFDLVLSYEDLGIIKNTNTIRTKQPVNVEIIKNIIKKNLK
jgi:LPS sulfotransferase NodH